MKKLSPEQLKRYSKAQDTKLGRVHVTVDEMHRKNLQAWIPYDLWMKIKGRVGRESTNMNEYVERAMATYLLLEKEDIDRIVARHAK